MFGFVCFIVLKFNTVKSVFSFRILVFTVFFLAMPRSLWGVSVLRPGIEPVPPAVEVQSPKPWTTRDVPCCIPLESLSYFRSTRFPLRLHSFGVWCSKFYSGIHNPRILETYMGQGNTFINFESTCEDIRYIKNECLLPSTHP